MFVTSSGFLHQISGLSSLSPRQRTKTPTRPSAMCVCYNTLQSAILMTTELFSSGPSASLRLAICDSLVSRFIGQHCYWVIHLMHQLRGAGVTLPGWYESALFVFAGVLETDSLVRFLGHPRSLCLQDTGELKFSLQDLLKN